MSLLVDRLPSAVAVGGALVPVRTDFRVGILFEGMMWDAALDARAKVAQALRLYYREGDLPGDLAGAYRAAVWFFAGGRDMEDSAEASDGQRKRLYDFDVDEGYIYAAFWAQYGLDLQAARLHWWAFRALFAGLDSGHEISRRMAVRAVNLAQVKDKAERARLAALQARVRLEGGGTAETMARRAGVVFR